MKVLIADDERQIRTGLQEGIPWESLGFHEVYAAENGIEALSLCRMHKPELVITDIRMPGMSGLELGEKIRELYAPVEIIILSGYSDFEYARTAITMGAFDYLLKPIRIREFVERVKNAHEKIEVYIQDFQDKNEFSVINRIRTLQQMIMSKELLSEKDQEIFRSQLQLKITESIVMGVCSVDTVFGHDLDQFGLYLEKCVHDLFQKYKAEELYWERGNLFFIMSVFSQTELKHRKEQLREEFHNCNKLLKNQFDNTVSVAFSSTGAISEVPILFRETETVLKKRLYFGKESFLEPETEDAANRIVLNPVNEEELKKRIESLDYEHIHVYLQGVFSKLEEGKVTSSDLVRSICQQLKNFLLKVLMDKGIDIAGIFENNDHLLNEIPDYFTIEEYENWIDTLYQIILKGLGSLSGRQHSRVVLQAVDYISKNYAGNINLENTAEYVQKSKNYFSYLFKKELGISFIDYLNQVRVEEAKKLLDTTDDKTYEISEKTGFNDYKYFSSVFKKITGMSPAQYKKRDKS